MTKAEFQRLDAVVREGMHRRYRVFSSLSIFAVFLWIPVSVWYGMLIDPDIGLPLTEGTRRLAILAWIAVPAIYGFMVIRSLKRYVQKNRLICPNCGLLLFDIKRKVLKHVIETGLCNKCGAVVLSDSAHQVPIIEI